MENIYVYVLVFDDYENTHVKGVYSSIDKAIEKATKEKIKYDTEFCSNQEVINQLETDDYAVLSAYFDIHRFEINDGEN